jgi:hypothetical protein
LISISFKQKSNKLLNSQAVYLQDVYGSDKNNLSLFSFDWIFF